MGLLGKSLKAHGDIEIRKAKPTTGNRDACAGRSRWSIDLRNEEWRLQIQSLEHRDHLTEYVPELRTAFLRQAINIGRVIG